MTNQLLNRNLVSFYCNNCDLDQNLHAIKQENRWVSWYVAFCFECGKELIRKISDPGSDPYYGKSIKLKKEREVYKRDLIQPGESGFKIYYKKQSDDLEKEAETREKKSLEDKKGKDKILKEYKNRSEKHIVKKIFDIEENNSML